MIDAVDLVQMLLTLGILSFGAIVVGEVARRMLAPIWWPMLFGFLLREFAWEPFWGLPGFGALLGSFVDGYTDTGAFIFFLGNLGVYLYLFREGLQSEAPATDESESPSHFDRPQVWSIALTGLLMPFGIGLAFCQFILGARIWSPAALLVGVSLTATSIAASAKILKSEFDRQQKPGGAVAATRTRLTELRHEVLSAAVLDDFLGLFMLLMVVAYVTEPDANLWETLTGFLGRTAAVVLTIGIGVVLFVMSSQVKPPRFASDMVVRHHRTLRLMPLNSGAARGLLGLLLLVVAASEHLRVSGLVAAYLLGSLMSWASRGKREREMALLRIEVSQVAGLLLPLYFVMSGMMVSFDIVREHWVLIAVLTAAAAFAKWLGCFVGALFGEVLHLGGSGFGQRLWKASLVFGPAMIPRGEVALVVVNIGFALGAFDQALLNILLVTVVLTTFIGPILFQLALRRWA